MTDEPLEPTTLPANFFTVDYVKTNNQPATYVGTSICQHGSAQSTTYLYDSRTIDPVGMVNSSIRHHKTMVQGCTCAYAPSGSSIDAQISFAAAPGTLPGQLRIIPQVNPNLTGSNFFYGGPLTGARMGAYVVNATVQLATGVRQGATGRAGILIAGRPALVVPLADVGGFATGSPSGLVRIAPNESVVVTYENTSSAPQDVTSAGLQISAAFVP